MSRPVRRRVYVFAAGAAVLAATVALPQNTLSAVTGGAFGQISSTKVAAGGGGNDRAPITKVPADKPATGEIYAGLIPAKAKTVCSGSYHVGHTDQCTHGPDKPPRGLDVHRAVAPVAPAITVVGTANATAPAESEVALQAGAVPPADATSPGFVAEAAPGAAAVGPNGVVCEGDGHVGKRVQVLYVRETGSADRFAQYAASFRTWAAGADAIYAASAAETGGVRHIRFVTTPDCQVDVLPVEVPAGALAGYSQTTSALKTLGYAAKDRIYMIFGDSNVYCGIGSMKQDDKPGAGNASNTGPGYGRSDTGCWTSSVISHELGHNLGAVNNSAPNSSHAGHCVDDYDIMCYNDAPGTVVKIVCTNRAEEQRLDCNHDDYFSTAPAAGSYLATHWNAADNDFLIKSDGTGAGTPPPPSASPVPSPSASKPVPPSPSAVPSPSASASPSSSPSPQPSPSAGDPSPSPSAGNPGLQKLTVTNQTSTSVSLSWPAAAGSSQYGLVVNGRRLGVLGGTAVRLVGMRPGTSYQLQITVKAASGQFVPHTAILEVTTAAASSAPAAGSWNVLTNAFTGMAADLYGGRSAVNTPAIAWPRHGYANQQWQPVAASGGSVLLKSKASGKCLGTRGAAAGSAVVQVECSAADAAQQWTLTASPYGFTLTTRSGLVVGIGSAPKGVAQPLVLQKATGARYQSWVSSAAK